MINSTVLSEFITTNLIQGQEDVSLTADDNLLISGLIDSLGIIQLVKYVEKENDITIAPGEITLKNFKTINAIVNFVEKKKTAV